MDKINTILKVQGRIWFEFENESFAGKGKVELIEKIKELGSLRKAALEMKMSYRQAWENVNKMNNLFNKPLVILKHGGKQGGIAQITDFGEEIISKYNEIQNSFAIFLQEQSEKLNV